MIPKKEHPSQNMQDAFGTPLETAFSTAAEKKFLKAIPKNVSPRELLEIFSSFNTRFKTSRQQVTRYTFTLQRIYRVTGINKETFAPRPIYDSIGMPYGEARAITQWDQNIAFITHDYRVAVLNNQGVTIVSDPLMTDLVDQHNESANFQLEYWGDLEKEWLVINAHRDDGIGFTRQYIMDIKKTTDFKKPFWYVPWDIRAQAMLSGRVSEATAQRRLVFAVWDDTLASGTLVRIDPTVRTGTDYRPDTNTYGMDINAETALFRVPAGNHVNQLRVPRLNPTFIGAQLERTQFPGDIDPEVFWYSDDLWSDPRSFIDPQDPERRVQSKGYKTMILPANDAAHRVALKIWLLDVEHLLEITSFVLSWTPNSGA
jgi:hypothetical protein